MTTKIQPPCERCGLKVVQRELEQGGVIYRFCDECYWGELKVEGRPVESGQLAPRTAAGGKSSGTR